MVEKRPNKALGRGLGALIKDKDGYGKNKKQVEEERRAKNMEFYRSLVKQYVQTGERDILTEQLLNDIRSHLNISDKEHLHLIQTLRKREQKKPAFSEEGKEEIQKEIKMEMKQLLNDIKKVEGDGDKKKGKKKKKKISITFEDDNAKKDRIRLPEQTVKVVNGKKRSKPIQAGPAEDDDWPEEPKKLKRRVLRKVIKRREEEEEPEKEKGKMVQTKVDWDEGLEYGKEPIPAKPPQPGLEESTDTIHASAPTPGMEDSKETLPMEPSKMDEEDEEVPLGVIVDEAKTEPVQTLVDDLSTKHLGAEDLEEVTEMDDQVTNQPIEETELVEEIQEMDEEDVEEPEEEVEELEPEPEEVEEVLDDSLMSIKILMDEGKLVKAHETAQRILLETPNNVEVLNECGVILYHLDNLQGAYDCYRKAFEIKEPSAQSMSNYALILSEMGELDASISILNQSIEKDPYSEDGWNNKAVVLYKAGRLREALECLDESLRINENSLETWMNAGIILEKMEEFGPALECYQSILENDPNNPVAMEGIDFCNSKL